MEFEKLDDGQVKQIHAEIKKARIKGQIDTILKEFGREESVAHDCYTTRSGSFIVYFGEEGLYVKLHSWGQFHENETVEIFWNEVRVFKGEYRCSFEPDCDPRLIIRFPKSYHRTLEICQYRSGEWLRFLSVRKIRQAIAKNAREEKRKGEKARKERIRQLNERKITRGSDSDVAKTLGISQ